MKRQGTGEGRSQSAPARIYRLEGDSLISHNTSTSETDSATGHASAENPGDRLVFTVEEAAYLLNISRALAYDLVARGEIPSIRLGRRIAIPRHQLETLLEGPDR
jgi:excisionase family DNA binding protein